MSGVPNIERVNISSRAQAPLIDDGNVLANTFGPEYRMLLIGAGQLTEYLATMAVFSGFAVTVCDPREEYRDRRAAA
jgi:xanthine dehydrogenase accessory factor